MSVCWLLIGDGRDEYEEASLASMEEMLPAPDSVIRVDDRDHKLGFAGAVQLGWKKALQTSADWIFHGELDFTYSKPVPVDEMAKLLEDRPYLAQLSLRRQPVGAEIPHGGFMEMQPGWYSEHTDNGRAWIEHVRNWTTNPSLYRREICTVGWPDAPDSEGHFGFRLRAQGLPWGVPGDEVRFGFWGGMEDGRELVTHIGEERAGVGY